MKLQLTVWAIIQVCSLVSGDPVPNQTCDVCSERMELGIVLDSSSSISEDDFSKGRRFLQEYLKKFKINTDGVRVSIITYGSTPHPEDSFNLTTYSNGIDVVEAIARIPRQVTYSTETGAGIKFMRENQLAPRFVRSEVPRVGLVLTDGNSQKGKVTADEAQRAREEGINMFAVGVGQKITNQELLNIAGSEDRLDRVDNYGKLETIVSWLVKMTCFKNKP